MADIESLELQITGNAQGAKKSIDSLITTLDKLKKATAGGCGLGSLVQETQNVSVDSVARLQSLSEALASLSKIKLGSVANQLKKLPEAVNQLSGVDFTAFSAKMQEAANAVKPLADEMQKVANGFSALPTNIQKFVNSSSQVPAKNQRSALSFAKLAAKISVAYVAFRRLYGVVASWINKSNEYVENLNLFSGSTNPMSMSRT